MYISVQQFQILPVSQIKRILIFIANKTLVGKLYYVLQWWDNCQVSVIGMRYNEKTKNSNSWDYLKKERYGGG